MYNFKFLADIVLYKSIIIFASKKSNAGCQTEGCVRFLHGEATTLHSVLVGISSK